MNQVPIKALSFDDLSKAVRSAAAIRLLTTLEPIGGPGDKVCPPTYEGGQYAKEERWVDNQTAPLARVDDPTPPGSSRRRSATTVLLDSVASQANRMELALLAAYDAKKILFPLIIGEGYLDAVGKPTRRITALETPHRCHAAIFRESLLDGKPFRESPQGEHLYQASLQNATPLLELCPHALIFGTWDSTMAVFKPGYLGPKFERALTSEIVGYDAKFGVMPGGAIDPLGIERRATIYDDGKGGWTSDEAEAAKSKDGKAILFGQGSETKPGRPSLINLSSVTPSFRNPDRKNQDRPGGVSITSAQQTTVLSLAGLRRFHFPPQGAKANPDTDAAAQTLLAALALCAITYARRDGYDLRSRCVLIPAAPAQFELVGSDVTQIPPFSLTPEEATALFDQTAKRLAATALGWNTKPIKLTPSPRLIALDRKSRALKRPLDGDGAEGEA